MQTTLRAHAESILQASLAAVQPDAAVRRALSAQSFPGPVTLIAAGTAAWPMAKAAYESPNTAMHRGRWDLLSVVREAIRFRTKIPLPTRSVRSVL